MIASDSYIRRRKTFRLFHFTILIWSVLALSACQKNDDFRKVPYEEGEKKAELSVRSFTMDSSEGKNGWFLEAEQAFLYDKGNKIELKKVHILDARDGTNLEAEQGNYLRDENKAYLYGGVHITTKNGRKLITEDLVYDEKLRKIHTDKEVEITFPEGDRITGTGLETDTKLEKIVIHKGQGYHPAK